MLEEVFQVGSKVEKDTRWKFEYSERNIKHWEEQVYD
jgi:hypothetical protein